MSLLKPNRNISTKVKSKLYIIATFGLLMFMLTAMIISIVVNKELAGAYMGCGLLVLIIPSKYHTTLITNIITFPITAWLALGIIILSLYYKYKDGKKYNANSFFYSTEFDDYDTKSITLQK